MGEAAERIMLAQLRQFREDLGRLSMQFGVVDAEYDELERQLHGHKTMMFGLRAVIGQIDKRVELLEAKIGG